MNGIEISDDLLRLILGFIWDIDPLESTVRNFLKDRLETCSVEELEELRDPEMETSELIMRSGVGKFLQITHNVQERAAHRLGPLVRRLVKRNGDLGTHGSCTSSKGAFPYFNGSFVYCNAVEEVKEMFLLASVCKRFNKVIHSPFLWTHECSPLRWSMSLAFQDPKKLHFPFFQKLRGERTQRQSVDFTCLDLLALCACEDETTDTLKFFASNYMDLPFVPINAIAWWKEDIFIVVTKGNRSKLPFSHRFNTRWQNLILWNQKKGQVFQDHHGGSINFCLEECKAISAITTVNSDDGRGAVIMLWSKIDVGDYALERIFGWNGSFFSTPGLKFKAFKAPEYRCSLLIGTKFYLYDADMDYRYLFIDSRGRTSLWELGESETKVASVTSAHIGRLSEGNKSICRIHYLGGLAKNKFTCVSLHVEKEFRGRLWISAEVVKLGKELKYCHFLAVGPVMQDIDTRYWNAVSACLESEKTLPMLHMLWKHEHTFWTSVFQCHRDENGFCRWELLSGHPTTDLNVKSKGFRVPSGSVL